MKIIILSLILLCMLLCAGCTREQPASSISIDYYDVAYDITMKRDLLCIIMAYPDYIAGIERNTDGNVYVIMKSGKRILYDDKRIKGLQEKLDNPDIQDMMEQIYPLSDIACLSSRDFNPGRIRVYPLLEEVYGQSKQEIQANLESVKSVYGNFLFNRNSGAATALTSVMSELAELMHEKKGISSFIYPIGGTFNYRIIAGTNRLSAHSFGIAIDLASSRGDYWKWVSREEGEKRLSKYPVEIIHVFEKNGFIWGGKWGYFDLMHYEYRPELILKSRYFTEDPVPEEKWYGSMHHLENAEQYIKMIEEALD